MSELRDELRRGPVDLSTWEGIERAFYLLYLAETEYNRVRLTKAEPGYENRIRIHWPRSLSEGAGDR